MSTALIIALVGAALIMMVGIAITMQNIEKSKKEKRRLESGLRTRARNFQFMLDGFPEGFLGRDLRALVAQCLLEVNTQLATLNPKDTDSQAAQNKSQQLLDQIKNESREQKSLQLNDPKQIKDIQKLLANLSNFINKLITSKRINAKQAKVYNHQIQRLNLQTTIDTIEDAARKAVKEDKFKLAVHYFEMAIDKMGNSNADGLFNPRIEKLQTLLEEFSSQAEQAASRREEADKEWDQIDKADDSWKKKALYD